jgi:DNA-binding NarL/FixJ family response regulator
MCNYALRMNEAKQAADLYRSGLSMRQIAQRLHVSQQAVKSALILLDVPRRDRVEARRLRWKIN